MLVPSPERVGVRVAVKDPVGVVVGVCVAVPLTERVVVGEAPVAVIVEVWVGVGVGIVGVIVGVCVDVGVGIVAVTVGVRVGVDVGPVGVAVGVPVAVNVGKVGVIVPVGVIVDGGRVGVMGGVCVGVDVRKVGVIVGVTVGVSGRPEPYTRHQASRVPKSVKLRSDTFRIHVPARLSVSKELSGSLGRSRPKSAGPLKRSQVCSAGISASSSSRLSMSDPTHPCPPFPQGAFESGGGGEQSGRSIRVTDVPVSTWVRTTTMSPTNG